MFRGCGHNISLAFLEFDNFEDNRTQPDAIEWYIGGGDEDETRQMPYLCGPCQDRRDGVDEPPPPVRGRDDNNSPQARGLRNRRGVNGLPLDTVRGAHVFPKASILRHAIWRAMLS
jgi:hypothetical protein